MKSNTSRRKISVNILKTRYTIANLRRFEEVPATRLLCKSQLTLFPREISREIRLGWTKIITICHVSIIQTNRMVGSPLLGIQYYLMWYISKTQRKSLKFGMTIRVY